MAQTTTPYDRQVEVDPVSVVTITFNEPMDASSTEAAVSTSRGTITAKTWNPTKTVLTLGLILEPGQKYIISVGADAKDLAQNPIEEELTFSFSIAEAPEVEDKGLGYPVSPLLLIAIILAGLGTFVRRGRR